MRNQTKVVVLGVVVGCAALFGLQRAGLLSRTARSGDDIALKTEAVARGQAQYKRIRVAVLHDLARDHGLRSLLELGTVDANGVHLSDADLDAIRTQTAEFLEHRFVNGEVSVYLDWRQRLGYVRLDAATLRREGVAVHYKLFTGKEYPGDDAIDRVHDEMWALSVVQWDRAHAISHIAAEPSGIALNFGRLTRKSLGSWPTASGRMSDDDWHGRSGGGHRSWWRPPSGSVHDHVLKHGFADVASFAIIVGYERGDRYPLRLMYYRDASTGRWWLEGLQALNSEYERFPMLEF